MIHEIHEVCAIFPMMNPDEFAGLKADIAANGQREPVWTHEGKIIDGRNRLKACQELSITPRYREWDGTGSLVEFVVSLNLHRRHLTSGQRAACATEAEERLAKEAEERRREAGRAAGVKSGEIRREKVEAANPTPRLFETPKASVQVAARPTPSVATVEPEPDIESEPETPKVQQRIAQPSKPREEQSRDTAAKLFGTNRQYVQDAKAIKEKAPELHEKVKAGVITLPQAKREVARAEKRADLETKAAAAIESRPAESKPDWTIIEGDSLKLLATITPGTARLVFADPPYNIGIDYGEGHDDKLDDEDFIEWSEAWIRAAADLLTPDGSMWVLINDEWADIFGCLLRDVGLHRRSWIKWYESFGVNTSNNFNRCSRHLFYVVKDKDRFVFNPDAVSRPSDRQVKYGDKRADPGGKIWDNVWGINPAIPRLVENAKERLPDFPTQLPLDLLKAVVGCASEPGDLVVDPFNGSGTTGEAAIRLGRRYIGIERSSQFARLARLRLTAARKDPDAS